MKEFIYKLAGHSEWIEQIKQGAFAFPNGMTLTEQQAVTAAVQNPGKSFDKISVTPDDDWAIG